MKIPIFTFHKISNGEIRSKYWISKDALFHKLSTLKDLGYETITMEQLSRCEINVSNPMVLTFDDGYQNFHLAVPMLHRLGMSATLFVCTGMLGKTNREWENYDVVPVPHLMRSEVSELESLGFDCQPHTVYHKNLIRLCKDEIWSELKLGKEDLASILGKEKTVFCYPGGGYNPEIQGMVKDAGYSMAACCYPAVEDTETMDRYAVKRLNCYSEIV